MFQDVTHGHGDSMTDPAQRAESVKIRWEGRIGLDSYLTTVSQFYLVTGGFSGGYLSSTEILDPRTGSWEEAAPFPRSLSWLACGSPRAGSVVCAGGVSDGGGDRDEVSEGHCPLCAL